MEENLTRIRDAQHLLELLKTQNEVLGSNIQYKVVTRGRGRYIYANCRHRGCQSYLRYRR